MKDQVHIRNAEAAHLARALARQTGKTISDVVLDALRQYHPRQRRSSNARKKVERWKKLLRQDRARRRNKAEITIESFYDEATGLPK